MELYESIRLRQVDLIAQNPASIIITRITKSADGAGGFTDTTSTLAAQTVRIYEKLRYVRIANINEAGWVIKKTQKMICQYNADVKAENATYIDKFTYNSKTYKIVDVSDMLTQNQIVFKECEIEMIT